MYRCNLFIYFFEGEEGVRGGGGGMSFLGFQAKSSPKWSCLIFTKNHCSLLQTFLIVWSCGLKLTVLIFVYLFFFFQCGFLAKKIENQVGVLDIYTCLMRGEEFWIFIDGHFHPIFLIRFDMLKIIVEVYNFWKRVVCFESEWLF